MSISTRAPMKHSESSTHTIARIARCKDCGKFTKVVRPARWYMGWEQVQLAEMIWSKMMNGWVQWVDARSKDARIVCSNCAGTNTSSKTIVGKYSEQECNEKCQGATGPACECKCEGKNHGGSHA